ncbi:carbon monoxide dehydrogenase subunit G [Aquimarina sp. EL_43]|uniref:SRPBCC family protein n=1 Tax=unclassified Aquimarina TaxID=2627091 RepID=UPI0018CB1913|nr:MULTISPECIES: SRPBCC family protein [unclassified Aquimarina]MBG6130913.1 carbon monoxide dehydrogenase subunit G [Aquimarina sp. EL_35]MBG6151372.1 carbon monoxide dehydrogenase subunit G [Aquimarina sp. EL_32]MBG6169303.1 carbon monoxide dehydrogenase subunit G [Aquimarina sp. EL_43]
MNLESPTVTVNKTAEDVFNFLTKVENFEQLMPESKQKFEKISDSRFLFQLKGMPELVLDQKESTSPSQVVLGAASDKLPFTLTADIVDSGDGKSTAKLTFDGQFNAMMSMMIKNPIQNFINTLIENIGKL